MHAAKKKLWPLASRGIQELQSFTRQPIVRRDFTGYSGAALVEGSRGSDVSGAKLKYDGASSWIGGAGSRLRMPKAEGLVTMEALRIGGCRQMGVTTRPGARAAEHGVRNPLPKPEGSPEWIEEQRQEEFLREARGAAASKVKQVEEAVGLPGGISFEEADTVVKTELGRSTTHLVLETSIDFIERSQPQSTGSQAGTEVQYEDTERSKSQSTGSQPGSAVHYDGILSDGIDEEVHRGLIADSEHPAGRVPVDGDLDFSSSDDDESLITLAFSDGGRSKKESDTDRTDKVHPYSADKLYSTDEALDKGQEVLEECKSVRPGLPVPAESDERSKGGVYGSLKAPL